MSIPLLASIGVTRRLAPLAVALTLGAGLAASPAQAQDINSNGWTVLEPSVDTRFIFVSSSEGSDNNNGLSPSNAVRTLARGKELIRDNSADWLLLKRGDEWRDESLGVWRLSGRSADERLVVSSYGDADERPRLVLEDLSGITGGMNDEVSHIAFVGVSMIAERDSDDIPTGIRWLSTGENLLIEDCLFDGFANNIVIQPVGGEYRNISIRRSVIIDSWNTTGHSQGIFVKDSHGLVLEENVFDHNGWNEAVVGANPTLFNQNIYLHTSTTGTDFHGNLTARAAGAGIQMRHGGNASENLIYSNSLGMRYGYNELDWPSEYATGVVSHNVVLGGDIALPDAPGAGIGFMVERARDMTLDGNVVANHVRGNASIAFSLNAHARDVRITNNVTHDYVNSDSIGQAIKSSAEIQGYVLVQDNVWNAPGTARMYNLSQIDGFEFIGNRHYGFSENENVFQFESTSVVFDQWASRNNVHNVSFSPPAFPDAGRDLDDYARHLGYNNAEDFIDAAREQSRRNWDSRLTGRAASKWIREGYIAE